MICLFDIGRVLLDFDFESSLARLLRQGDSAPEHVVVRLGRN